MTTFHPGLGKAISIMMAVLALMLSIVGVNDLFDALHLDPKYRIYLIYGSAGLGLAILSVLVILLTSMSARTVVKFSRREFDYTLTLATAKDIEGISEIAHHLFGANVSVLQKNIELHSFDSRIFTPIKNDKGRLSGYICLIRLSARGVKAIEQNNFWFSNMPMDYLRSDTKTKEQTLYVGAIYGENAQAKAFALGSTMMLLREIKPKRVFARAATKDGMRVLTKHGFKPLFGRMVIDELFVRESTGF